jgi:aldose 1-epimerase
MRISEEPWGTLPGGSAVMRYTLTNGAGARAQFMPYGAAVLAVEAPDRDGALADVVLGYATAADYATGNSPYIGLTIGRYASRIAGSTIALDGKTYQLAGGQGGQLPREILHGGADGFSNRVWTAARVETADGPGLRFTLVSPDGDQGHRW